jgi:hypothetical protein
VVSVAVGAGDDPLDPALRFEKTTSSRSVSRSILSRRGIGRRMGLWLSADKGINCEVSGVRKIDPRGRNKELNNIVVQIQ